MELDPHMQMDFGPAPQNYWGPPPLRPGEEQGGAPADDAAELTPAQVALALGRTALHYHNHYLLYCYPTARCCVYMLCDGHAQGSECLAWHGVKTYLLSPLLCGQLLERPLSNLAWQHGSHTIVCQPQDGRPHHTARARPVNSHAPCRAQLLEGLRPELERRLNLEPGDNKTWADITDGAAEGVEQFAFLRAPDVWVRARAAAVCLFKRAPRIVPPFQRTAGSLRVN